MVETLPPIARWFAPLEPLVAAAGAWRREFYRGRGAARVIRLPIPVVSVGNLAVGGAGKTPMVETIVEHLTRSGFAPGVVMGAYKARPPLQPTENGTFWRRSLRWAFVSDGEQIYADVETAGDEAVMFALKHPTVPLAAGKDKARTALELASELPLDAVVLDDGFQSLRLARDLDIVLLDAARPLDNGRTLPAGCLRERPEALADADIAVLVEGEESAEEDGEAAIRPYLKSTAPVVRARRVPCGLTSCSGESLPLSGLNGAEILGVCGIGNPRQYEAMLRRLGARVEMMPFPDHRRYGARDWDEIERAARGRTVVATAKDAVKWEDFPPFPYLTLSIRMELDAPLDDILNSALKKAAPPAAKANS